jgi:acetylxylan esterase
MKRQRAFLMAGLVMAFGWPAEAAELTQINGFSTGNVPGDVSMHIYVPDQVATNPPLLLLVHYCGGTASAVFGQARGGGIVDAADQRGFIMVVPSSGRCWDVVSDKTRTRGGGGDTDAIMQMVDYALETHDANVDRIYATGDSSGGMMTELLLGMYPEVFKAGAAFAGMPAGCRGAGESGNGGGYSGACAGGTVMHTAQEWGDIARGLAPGHMGPRPRVQLFHGDADDIIKLPNHTEAIEQWTNVLGLDASPASTDMGVELGDHQATRQRWQNACGKVVVDAFTSLGGDHGPSDALFPAEYVIPFLGLDQTGPLDPVVEGCGNGGSGGSGGAGGATAGSAGLGGTGIDAGGASGGSTASGASGMAQAGGLGGGGSGAVGTSGASNQGSVAGSAASRAAPTASSCTYSGRKAAPCTHLLGGLTGLGLTLTRLRRRAQRRSCSSTTASFLS